MLLLQELKSKFSCLFLLVLGFGLLSECVIYQEPLNIQDIESLFDDDDCMEGSLGVTESGDPVIKFGHYISSIPQDSATKTEEKNETTSDKSPTSLIYELAEFNQIKVQFALTDEKGPPHKKQFVVQLKIGEEEYVGEGGSIKKAQQEASKLALNSTLYAHPPEKIKTKVVFEKHKTSVQKLETWAREHNDATVVYSYFEQTELMDKGLHVNYYHSGMYSKAKNIHKVSVKVENKLFSAEGASFEIAKERAASHALESLQRTDGFCMLSDKEKSFFNKVFDSSSDNHSPVSLVHEFGTISNMQALFDLHSEEGPPHIKKFVFRCNVGDSFETFGEGSSKKDAKKEAAQNMINKLKIHSTFNKINCGEIPRRSKTKKKKSRKNLIKSDVKIHSEEEEAAYNAEILFQEELDPVSKLYQIQQAKHEVLPTFTLLEKSNNEFYIEVRINDLTAIGSAPNKNAAKKRAAQAILEKMGYSAAHKKDQGFSQEKKKDFSEGEESLSKNHIVPGINLNSNKLHQMKNVPEYANNHGKSESMKNINNAQKSNHKISSDNLPQSKESPKKKDRNLESQRKTDLKPKLQLLNLSQQLGFKFQFSDFPKANNTGFVSLVSLTTDPPKVCYGIGETSDHSQDKAALSALSTLYKSQISQISQLLQEENNALPKKTKVTIIEKDVVQSGAKRETD